MADSTTVNADSTEVLEMADQWQAAGRRVAIATVVVNGRSDQAAVAAQAPRLFPERGAELAVAVR